MKPKYILENYDRILKEIKNPKIIFSSDLVPFLENFAPVSYLIYQVDFSIEENTTKYILKKPIHNLHPKAKKINFNEFGVHADFKLLIPEILEKLKIPIHQMSLRSCSKNDNIVYILKECEIEDLSQENRFFLYCYHSLKNENQKTKKIIKEIVFNFKSRERIEQHIHLKQDAIENLVHRLLKEINPTSPSELYHFSNSYSKTDCLRITYIYLEKLLRFIEKEYHNYLNVNIQIPYRSALAKEFEITNQFKEIHLQLLESNLNKNLLALVNEPLTKITTKNIQEKLTYYEFNYCSEYTKTLHKRFDFENTTEEKTKEFLFEINFNSLQFFKYLTFEILEELNLHESNLTKIDILNQFLKNYNQKQIRTSLKYKANLPSLKEQIISWIEEEIEYLTKKIKLETKQFPNLTNNDEKAKILTGLSVAQLSYFFGLLMETGIIKHKNQTEIFRFISDNFKTNNTEKISVDSLKVKYYNVENSTKNAIRQKIIELLGLTKH